MRSFRRGGSVIGSLSAYTRRSNDALTFSAGSEQPQSSGSSSMDTIKRILSKLSPTEDSSDQVLFEPINVNELEHGLTDPTQIFTLETILEHTFGDVRKQKLLKFFSGFQLLSNKRELLNNLGVSDDSIDRFTQNNVPEELNSGPNASNTQLNQVAEEENKETESGVDANNGGDILKDPEAVEQSAFHVDGDSQSNDESIIDGVSNTGNIGKKNTDSSGKGDKS
jgi:hypothetical protein